MVYGCGNKCVKFFVFFVNFLIFAFGIVILALALSIRYSKDVQQYFQSLIPADSSVVISQLYIPLYILAGVGGLLILTGFLGCCGAWCENTCLLAIFFAIVLILFLAELGCGIALLVSKDSIKNEVFDAIGKQISNYWTLSPEQQQSIDEIQKDLNCCGCTGPSDYPKDRNPPASCFASGQAVQVGCCEKVWDKAESQLAIVGGVALGILVIELLAMIFSCILCRAAKRGDYQYA